MRKYLTIIKASWQRSLTYRFSVITYRIGEVGEMLGLILMWTAVYGGQTVISGLTLPQMVTYILVGNFFNAIIRNFLPGIVARDIREGRLSMFLVKPMGYFGYTLAQEIGRISLATMLSVLTASIVILFFRNTFFWNADPAYLVVISITVMLAFVTELLLAYLIGLIAFWTDEVDGIYMSIDRIKKFFSGGYFPLSLLPLPFVQLSFTLPFAYSFFVPAQLYLKKIDLSTGLRGICVQIIWIIALYGIIAVVWKRGLKRYEGVGM